MLRQRCTQLIGLSFLNHFGQGLHDLLFRIIEILQLRHVQFLQ